MWTNPVKKTIATAKEESIRSFRNQNAIREVIRSLTLIPGRNEADLRPKASTLVLSIKYTHREKRIATTTLNQPASPETLNSRRRSSVPF